MLPNDAELSLAAAMDMSWDEFGDTYVSLRHGPHGKS